MSASGGRHLLGEVPALRRQALYSPAFAHLNKVAVVHTGTVNMATGELIVNVWRPATAERREPAPAYASYPG